MLVTRFMEKKELSIAEDCIESVTEILTKMQKVGKDFSSAFYEMIDSFFNLFLISNLAKYGFDYKAAFLDYKKSNYDFYLALTLWFLAIEDASSRNITLDFFGETYERYAQSAGKAKQYQQYFTPRCVADLTAALNETSKTVNDPACGSGRLLLAHHQAAKKTQLIYYLGQDLDGASCKMCALNMMANKMHGQVCNIDTLLNKFIWGVNVNEGMFPFFTDAPTLRLIKEDERR